jgi:FixJ family two-component response regulator
MEARMKGMMNRMKRTGKEKLSVFLVDDDESYLKVISHQLKTTFGKDINLHVFNNGDDCINNLHLNPDVVVLDHYLNENDQQQTGLILLKQLKRLAPELKVILISGMEDIQLSIAAVKAGALDFIVKGKNTFKRLMDDFSKVIRNLVLQSDEKDYQEFINIIYLTVALVTVSIVTMYTLFPSVMNM